ncbi:hypothetical protein LDENG_00244860 [Lucifuga dentata]|nr:hypothetical protein LDENG_00244860 [Lucifuga dentata]
MPSKIPKSVQSSAGNKEKGKAHPDDIFPLVLTSATQELFGCRTDADVTAENPYKLLKKDDIVQDMKTRAAMSDFSTAKKLVLDYPEDELLLVFDRNFTYGNSFYLVVTPEAKDRILNPPPEPESETSEVLESEVTKTPESKQWISLGSEQEIDDESVKESRDKLKFNFSRERRKFGAPVCFSDRNVADAKDGYIECTSYQDHRFSIKHMEIDCGMQCVPKLQSSSAQTEWKFQKNMYTQYEPRGLEEEEKENILQSESLRDFTNSVTPRVLQALQQNEIMDVFLDEWEAVGTGAEDVDWSGKAWEGLMLCQAFSHQKYTKEKKVTCIHWHPNIYGVIATALADKVSMEKPNSSTTEFAPRNPFILFYSFSDPSEPQLLLESPDDIFAFEFCPSDPNIIVGGCRNGQVVLWDISNFTTHLHGTRSGGRKISSVKAETFDLEEKKEIETPIVQYCAMSILQSSHKAPITDIQWLPQTFEVTRMGLPVENKNNISVQVVTCAPDCSILFWDIRIPKTLNLQVSSGRQNMDEKLKVKPYSAPDTFKHLDRVWKPLFKVSLPKIGNSGEYAPLKFNMEHYTCDGHSSSNAGGAHLNDERSGVSADYRKLRVPSPKTLKFLEGVKTKLYIGTEDGEIIYTDWKLEKDDSGQLRSAKPSHCFNIHHWMVNTVQWSPFFKDIFVTTGGWNFAIWKEGVMLGPIVQSPCSDQLCTAGCWSLSRPGVLFMGKEDGNIEVWNLLEKSSEPSQVHVHVTNSMITCIKPWVSSSKQHFLAVSDVLGMIRVFEIPKTLHIPSRNEYLSARKYFEGEVEKLWEVMKMDKVDKEKEMAEELEKKKQQEEVVRPMKSQEEIEKEELKEYRDFLMLEEEILKAVGLLLAPVNTQET